MTSAFDHPFLSGLLGDDALATLLGADAELTDMLAFEVALASAQADLGLIPAQAAQAIASTLQAFRPDLAALKAGVARDGVVVPELVRQLREATGQPYAEYLHFGATSQDVIDTAMMLRLRRCLRVLHGRIDGLEQGLAALSARSAGRFVTGYTRMQPALRISANDRLAAWSGPLLRLRARLDTLLDQNFVIQFGGAAGTLEKLGDKASDVRMAVAAKLELLDAPQWHSQRDRVTEIAGWLSELTGVLGKLGQDVALMAAQGGEIDLAGGGSSSAMPHKQNPVAAEALVALARFNATQISAMHHALVHEQERSGAAWTLEWMVLPQIVMATGAATLQAAALLENIRSVGCKQTADPAAI